MSAIAYAAVVVLLACLPGMAGTANTLTGKVIRVVDGDTLMVADGAGVVRRVRLKGIDSPDKLHGYHRQSKAALAAEVTNQTVRVVWSRRDCFGRILGTVYVGPVDVCWQMVADGWARHYAGHGGDGQLAVAERSARRNRLGLWRNVEPPPEPPGVLATNLHLEVHSPPGVAEPVCWVADNPSLGVLAAVKPKAVGAARTTTSSFDAAKVGIAVEPPTGTSAWGVEEALPVGLTPSGITGPNGSWNTTTRKITWYSTGEAPAALGYSVTGAGTTHTLNGNVNFDGGADAPISGDTQVGAFDGGSNRKWVAWYGWYNDAYWPWIWDYEFSDWLWVIDNGPQNVWFWSNNKQKWMWTRTDWYRWVWYPGDAGLTWRAN